MKDFKGTKGKWNISKYNGTTVVSTYGLEIADVYDGSDSAITKYTEKNKQEAKSNAQLIAAAPELLESLLKLVEMLRSPCVINKEGFLLELDQETERAKNIINKALGKEDSYE